MIMHGAVASAQSVRLDLYHLLAAPHQNEENSFDFTLPTVTGKEYLDLVEIVVMNKGGHASAPSTFNIGELADEVFALIKKKSKKYRIRRGLRLHLLLYSTDWRMHLNDSAISLLRLYSHRRQQHFKSIACFNPITTTHGVIWQVYPVPPDVAVEQLAVSEAELRSRTLKQGAPMKWVATPDSSGVTMNFE